jgi:hypothetical protein
MKPRRAPEAQTEARTIEKDRKFPGKDTGDLRFLRIAGAFNGQRYLLKNSEYAGMMLKASG